MHLRPSLRLVLGLLALAPIAGRAAGQEPEPPRKALVEFGWDEPDTAFLRRHIEAMERTPFDGCVFHAAAVSPAGAVENFTWLGWGKRTFTRAELQGAIDDLRATPFRRFTENFLRFNTTPADLDWFDDFGAVLANARLAAEVAREGNCRGILFDVEEYQGRLFTYAHQRDAKTRSWDEYAAQARGRGRAVMEAFQEGFPGLTVLLTFGHSYALIRSERLGGKPLAEVDYGLLAPFLDGLVDAAKGSTRLVDGHEPSYGYREAARFDEALARIRDKVPATVAADPEAYRRAVTAGFGLWMDYIWPTHGWDTADPSRNYFTPEAFEASLRAALERADRYVWIYTETPRWWTPEGGPAKLPPAYEAAVRRARRGLATD